MNAEIESRFNKLEERRQALVARVRALSPEKQQAKPSPKEFSPAEVLMHFFLAEDSNVAFLRKTPPSSLKGKTPKMTFIFRKTVASMEQPTKAIATVGYMIPKGTTNVDEADQKWATSRADLKGFLEKVENPKDPFCKFLFFFGLASADDYLRLMESHMTYHEARFPTS
ncbi:MAG: DinB family protein [Fimbriimonadaceae bacterium]